MVHFSSAHLLVLLAQWGKPSSGVSSESARCAHLSKNSHLAEGRREREREPQSPRGSGEAGHNTRNTSRKPQKPTLSLSLCIDGRTGCYKRRWAPLGEASSATAAGAAAPAARVAPAGDAPAATPATVALSRSQPRHRCPGAARTRPARHPAAGSQCPPLCRPCATCVGRAADKRERSFRTRPCMLCAYGVHCNAWAIPTSRLQPWPNATRLLSKPTHTHTLSKPNNLDGVQLSLRKVEGGELRMVRSPQPAATGQHVAKRWREGG